MITNFTIIKIGFTLLKLAMFGCFSNYKCVSNKAMLVARSGTAIESARVKHWLLQFDGGSRGNPGRGGSGAVIYAKYSDGVLKETWYGHQFLGYFGITNNVAEYVGLIAGLKQCVKMKLPSLIVQGDSQLVIRQLEGTNLVKNKNLIVLHSVAKQLLDQIPDVSLHHIPRELNKRADELSNMAMELESTFSLMHDCTSAKGTELFILAKNPPSKETTDNSM